MLIAGEVLPEANFNIEKDSTPDYFGECMQPRGEHRR
jgi:hypothetical protein